VFGAAITAPDRHGDLAVFSPDPERARELTDKVRLSLADSLAAIRDRLSERFNFEGDSLGRIVDAIRTADRVRPEVFALYHTLVRHLGDGDLLEAKSDIDRLGSTRIDARPIELSHLDPAVMGTWLAATYVGNVEDPTAAPFGLVPLSPGDFDSAARSIARHIAVFDEVVPDCAGECRALISELILTANDPEKASFGAASSFNQWGGVVANVSMLDSLVRLVPTLVHEATHLLLFGLAMDEPLLSTEAGRRFPSPLRDELRTMDGVYHATIVCARMHYGLDRLRASDRLTGREHNIASRSMDHLHARFEAGAKTVSENADLAPIAERMITQARTYLSSHRGAA
jgi:hypothetical protein